MATARKRGNSYQIRVSVGYDVKGKQVIRTKTWKPDPTMTERQIKNELQKQIIGFENECLSGLVPSPVKFQALAQKWLDEQAILSLRKNTLNKYHQVTHRIYPAFGHLRIDRITPLYIQDFVNDLAMNGKNMMNGRPLSRKTVLHHLTFISDVFNYAVRLGMASENPCRRVMIPKGEVKEKDIYTVEEVKRILSLLDDEKFEFRMFFILAVFSGFRRGELLGLEWKDVDFDNNVISVRRTANYTARDGNFTDTTKTKKSQRSVKFVPEIMSLLKEYKSYQNEKRTAVGTKWIETDRIFTRWNGETMSMHAPYSWFRNFTERHGMRFCDIHSLRHFHASLLIDNGFDLTTVSREMGHSTVSTTANIYCHQLELAEAKTSVVMSTALLSQMKQDAPN